MTSETYLDLTFDRSTKGGKRPLRPKLLKLTDAAIPRRNRKKTKTKSQTKDRSLSSVRDRIYDDPAYTDDISHLANPLRPRSYERRSSNVETKAEAFPTVPGKISGGSLDKRSKLARKFLLYANNHNKGPDNGGGPGGGGSGNGGGGVESFGHEGTSSSDEHSPADKSGGSLSRRGHSLDRSYFEKCEKRHEQERDRTTNQQQKCNPGGDNCALEGLPDKVNEKPEPKSVRSKERKYQDLPSKQYSEELRSTWSDRTPDVDMASTSTATDSKMHIGRRFLRGEIGIKSFNYYLLKEGLKSSKRLVGKQRSSSSAGRSVGDKKQQSRSEENIYEEIFFKDASASDEENQNEPNPLLGGGPQRETQMLQQQELLIAADVTPDAQVMLESAVFPNCDLCMQHCNKENCEYCYAVQIDSQTFPGGMACQQLTADFSTQEAVAVQNRQQFDNMRRQVAVEANSMPGIVAEAQPVTVLHNAILQPEQTMNGNSNNNMPAAHILEFQSYNPNNPGVYKIETTPVAITGEYNPILQFQQSSTTSSTTTTTPSERQQPYIQFKQVAHHGKGLVQDNNGMSFPAGHYYQANVMPLLAAQARPRVQRFPPGQHQQYILSYNGSPVSSGVGHNMSVNTKSSSSSDSLQHQQHKFNTVARMEANVPYGDPFYGGGTSNLIHMHPLIYASSRPLGGSQILLDDQTPHMYKSDSRASILSEYSLRSSDNSHRYGRYLHHRSGGGRGEVSDSSYFGSTESCRFGFECRRCSLDNGSVGVGISIGDCSSSYFSSDFDDAYGSAPGSSIPRKTAAGILPSNAHTDIERLEEQMDRKQNKYAKDFFKHVNDVKRSIYQSEMQRNGTLETTSSKLKATKSSDANSGSKTAESKSNSKPSSDARSAAPPDDSLVYTTLLLSKDRARIQGTTAPQNTKPVEGTGLYKPIAAPRTSLQQTKVVSSSTTSQAPMKSQAENERREYPSLDRLLAAATSTGAIPKSSTAQDVVSGTSKSFTSSTLPTTSKSHATHTTTATAMAPLSEERPSRQSPKKARTNLSLDTMELQGEKSKETNADSGARMTKVKKSNALDEAESKLDRYLNVSSSNAADAIGSHPKRHHRNSSTKQSSSSGSRRRDMPVAPPPSPATYSDLRELKENLESMQDDTNSPKRSESLGSTTPVIHEKSNSSTSKMPTETTPSKDEFIKLTTNAAEASSAQKPDKSSTEVKAAQGLLDTEEDDVFYDARSEDSCGAVPSATKSKSKTPTQPGTQPQKHSSKGKERKNFDDGEFEQRNPNLPHLTKFIETGQQRTDAIAPSTASTKSTTSSKAATTTTTKINNENDNKRSNTNSNNNNNNNEENEGGEGNKLKHNKSSKDDEAALAPVSVHERVIGRQSKKDNGGKEIKKSATAATAPPTTRANKHQDCGDFSKIANDDTKPTNTTTQTTTTAPTTTTTPTMVALNPVERNATTPITTIPASTATTTTTANAEIVSSTTKGKRATATTTTTKAATFIEQKHQAIKNNDIVASDAATNTTTAAVPAPAVTTKLRKHGERRSKSSAPRHHSQSQSQNTANRQQEQQPLPQQQQQQQQQQQMATNSLLTISCDTCCQIESEERRRKEKQLKVASKSSSNRTWRLKAESDTITKPQQQQQQQQQHQTESLNKTNTVEGDTCTNIESATTKTTTAATTTAVTWACAEQQKPITASDTQNKLENPNGKAAADAAATRTPDNMCPATAETETEAVPECERERELEARVSGAMSPTMPNTAIVSERAAEEDEEEAAATEIAANEAEAELEVKVARKAVAPNNGDNSATSSTNTAISCNSDIAGVATHANSPLDVTNSGATLTATTTTTAAAAGPAAVESESTQQRRVLQRQEYSCLDSSEAQSDDSHLTRDSITRESQNDELSSSTLDKIDVSILPLPALPPKKRRTRQRASPSKYYHNRNRHEGELPGEELVSRTGVASNAALLHVNETAETQHLSAFQQYVAKRRESLETSSRNFNEKLEARRKMHYHMAGGGGGGSSGGSAMAADAPYNAGANQMPTYLFGESVCNVPSRQTHTPATREEIFLNKSGWVQVNTKRAQNESRANYRHFFHSNGSLLDRNADPRNTIRVIQIDDTRRSDMTRKAILQHQHSVMNDAAGYAVPKFVVSKVEELIKRNEVRLGNTPGNPAARDVSLRPGYRIVDPHLASILNERPGFLPVRNPNDAESPPPITPILSPPPAFQDSSKSKRIERRKGSSNRQPWNQAMGPVPTGLYVSSASNAVPNGKGMVFSRSFEYDARRTKPADNYVETFSRSFDGNLSERPTTSVQRDRSPNFSTLTGNSPNYLTKKDSGGGSSGSLRSRDSSPKYQQPRTTAYLNTSVKEAPPSYSLASGAARHSPRTRRERSFERSKTPNVGARSRKSQFNRMGSAGLIGSEKLHPSSVSRFRSFDTSVSQRLNSCDSGARSDLSNDELDNEDEPTGSSEFLTINYQHNASPLKKQRQRSLTPDRNESRSSSGSLRKQRSLTPESRSLTPEDRWKKGSQASLLALRQNTGSRNNTLERKQCVDEKTPYISRSSSSSSYSGSREREPQETKAGSANTVTGTINSGAHHRRSLNRVAKQTEEHRIRRSRSLQLSERSPSRAHATYACLGQQIPGLLSSAQTTAAYQQSAVIGSSGGTPGNLTLPVRTSGKSHSVLVQALGGNDNNVASSGSSVNRVRNTDIDKSHSFDFDYNYYNSPAASAMTAASKIHNNGSNSKSNQNVPMRLDFDKSRSFDDDYRETLSSNSSMRAGAHNPNFRYLQARDSAANNAPSRRLRKTSPGGTSERNTRSPQQSGSPCSNMRLPRQTTSPQNYGTRLCDHELTYDKLRKSLDRSPIMDFCQSGDACDYDMPRNRETINSGGNSELNFMNNDPPNYETPTTTSASSLRQQRPLSHSQSNTESPYATPETVNSSEYRSGYGYRQLSHHHAQPSQQQQHREARSGNRGSPRSLRHSPPPTNSVPKTLCAFHPNCGACRSRSVLHKRNSPSTISSNCNVQNMYAPPKSKIRNKSPWKLLCTGTVPTPTVVDTKPCGHIIEEPPSEGNTSTVYVTDSSQRLPRPTLSANFISQAHIQLAAATTKANSKKSKTLEILGTQFLRPQTNIETCAEPKQIWKFIFRSISLPDLTSQSPDFGFTLQRKRSPTKLKMRAVSSPSLNDPEFEKTNQDTLKKDPSKVSEKRPNSYPNMGVLQKFKRTFAGFNSKSALQRSTDDVPSHSPIPPQVNTTDDSSVSMKQSINNASIGLNEPPASKNLFGSLIFRSSKQCRRNTDDKCYSGDSGIQIELEADERAGRGASGSSGDSFNKRNESDDKLSPFLCNTDAEFVTQVRRIRRAYSTKTAHVQQDRETDTDVGMKSKPQTRNVSKERKPPESMLVRSISQPQSLESFGGSKPSSEDSDKNSIGSHDEGESIESNCCTNYYPMYAEVMHNFTAVGPQELGLERGTLIEVLRKEPGPWWFGRIKKEEATLVEEILDPELGWFPKDFVRVIQFPETDEFFLTEFVRLPTLNTYGTLPSCKVELEKKPASRVKDSEGFMRSTRRDSVGNVITTSNRNSNITTIIIESPTEVPTLAPGVPLRESTISEDLDIIHMSAIKELLTTEVNYVKLLTSICEGYLPAMSKRIDIFAPNSIRLIFSNITAIYSFQRKFLEELRKGIEKDQVAKVFLKMHKGFLCYSTYCNSYPRALIELESYDRVKEARIILENCRESENLTEFPLAAHLLSPVQRICRYPLHLGEIMKMASRTEEKELSDQQIKQNLELLEQTDANLINMPDTRKTVEMALEAMKGITEAVNEGKRHSETIARHQTSFQNFKGPPLHLHSTRFFLQIDATRQKQNLWNSSYTLFMFDNQLIYCKRDIIKRSQFIYKGRIFIDRCRVVNVRDGKMFGQTIKNALRIYCEARDKWYDFSFRSANRKQKFLHTLALERQFGGKALYISEMTGFDYALRERSVILGPTSADLSDQSDYEFGEIDYVSTGPRITKEDSQYINESSGGNIRGSIGSGNHSLTESPTMTSLVSNSVALPKKSKSRDNIGVLSESETNTLGRRRLSNWFRKPKSSNSTPNLSPTHKPLLPVPLITQLKELQLEVINKLGNSNASNTKSSMEG